jgi:2-polyprenyl-3-methyl-5-hydroxy-6-metoxy-1,4-benzoquinol methylase
MLDVGCATGGFLRIAQPQYECYGFDASPAQADHAKRHCPTVRHAIGYSDYLTKIHLSPGSFHLITMWDVLEHIREPIPFLQDLSPGLARDGLFFASVPAATPMRIKSRMRRLWPGFTWSPHEHAAYYSPSTLAGLVERAGLKVLRVFAVKVYPRDLAAFEVLRRLVFTLTSFTPGLSPQIGILARKP